MLLLQHSVYLLGDLGRGQHEGDEKVTDVVPVHHQHLLPLCLRSPHCSPVVDRAPIRQCSHCHGSSVQAARLDVDTKNGANGLQSFGSIAAEHKWAVDTYTLETGSGSVIS